MMCIYIYIYIHIYTHTYIYTTFDTIPNPANPFRREPVSQPGDYCTHIRYGHSGQVATCLPSRNTD